VLIDLDLQPSYRTGRDSLLDDFYIPCLQEAASYDRAVGYFSSSLLHVVAVAYSDFALREGRMRLLCSPALTPDDFDAMASGAEIAKSAQGSILAELRELLNNPEALAPTKLLATLVGLGILEVRLAVPTHPQGIFHDKLGLFADETGRRVSFVGSANETWAAWGLNHESFEVFCSWKGERELLRTRSHAQFFDRLWQGLESGVRVDGLASVTREELLRVADEDLERAIDAVRLAPRKFARHARQVLPHQTAVLESWEDAGNRGIVSFATGAGKTLVAIEAIRRWTAQGHPALVLVPTTELHRQWYLELANELSDATILTAGAGSSRGDWEQMLVAFCTGDTDRRRIILATMQTFATDSFQERLTRATDLLLVADEVHRAGSESVLVALERAARSATLGLSATYRRQWDDSGTRRLLGVFGPVLEPVIGIAEAITIGLLVPYSYRVHTLTLEASELEDYVELTGRIRRLVAQTGPEPKDNAYLRILLLQRARILKQARGKVPAAVRVLRDEYSRGDRWLVYCDGQVQLRMIIDECARSGLPVMEYHSAMIGERAAALKSLAEFGGVTVAIRCLDEGVDIPVCDRALIVASTTVEREYVQRRGRVLRRAPGKESAIVHDLLLTDERGGALTRGEALRALEFARLSRNPGARVQLQLLVALSQDVATPELGWIHLDEEEQELGRITGGAR
jgi:superfamily II DNA or RNA helicase